MHFRDMLSQFRATRDARGQELAMSLRAAEFHNGELQVAGHTAMEPELQVAESRDEELPVAAPRDEELLHDEGELQVAESRDEGELQVAELHDEELQVAESPLMKSEEAIVPPKKRRGRPVKPR